MGDSTLYSPTPEQLWYYMKWRKKRQWPPELVWAAGGLLFWVRLEDAAPEANCPQDLSLGKTAWFGHSLNPWLLTPKSLFLGAPVSHKTENSWSVIFLMKDHTRAGPQCTSGCRKLWMSYVRSGVEHWWERWSEPCRPLMPWRGWRWSEDTM